MADLSELLERLRAATGADDDLDYAITQFVDPGAVRHSSAHLHYTGSIDDALALVERLLPGWIWDITSTGTAWVMDPNNNDCLYTDGGRQAMTLANLRDPPSFTPPLAILAALLAALTAIQSIGDETDGR